MRIADLVEQLRYLDPELEVNATLTRYEFMSEEEVAECILPDGTMKRSTLRCKSTGRPVKFVQIQLDWRSPEQRIADRRALVMGRVGTLSNQEDNQS